MDGTYASRCGLPRALPGSRLGARARSGGARIQICHSPCVESPRLPSRAGLTTIAAAPRGRAAGTCTAHAREEGTPGGEESQMSIVTRSIVVAALALLVA